MDLENKCPPYAEIAAEEKRRTAAATTRFVTPFLEEEYMKTSRDEKIGKISYHFEEIMKTLGLDVHNESLKKTPQRVAKMYVDELFSGLPCAHFPTISMFAKEAPECDNVIYHESMVITKTKFTSFCEHHFVPMVGVAFVGYIPQNKIIGLSKVARIVHYFAARPQLQERLSAQIGDCLSLLFEHANVAVYIKAEHYCVTARGVQNEPSNTITLYTDGLFRSNTEIKNEFLKLIEL